MAYLVYYKGKDVLTKVSKMSVNIAYISKKMNYLVFYGEASQEKNYLNQLKNVKGFVKLELSDLYNPDANFDI